MSPSNIGSCTHKVSPTRLPCCELNKCYTNERTKRGRPTRFQLYTENQATDEIVEWETWSAPRKSMNQNHQPWKHIEVSLYGLSSLYWERCAYADTQTHAMTNRNRRDHEICRRLARGTQKGLEGGKGREKCCNKIIVSKAKKGGFDQLPLKLAHPRWPGIRCTLLLRLFDPSACLRFHFLNTTYSCGVSTLLGVALSTQWQIRHHFCPQAEYTEYTEDTDV